VLQLAFTLARNIQYDSPDVIYVICGTEQSSAFWGFFAFLLFPFSFLRFWLFLVAR